jgi:hypothetical protein
MILKGLNSYIYFNVKNLLKTSTQIDLNLINN